MSSDCKEAMVAPRETANGFGKVCLRTIAFSSSAIVCCDRYCRHRASEAVLKLLALALLPMGVDHAALSQPAAMEGQKLGQQAIYTKRAAGPGATSSQAWLVSPKLPCLMLNLSWVRAA